MTQYHEESRSIKMKEIFTNILRCATRILYKYWVIGVLWFVWDGIYKLAMNKNYKYYDQWVAVFIVIAGLAILYSERKYIKYVNEDWNTNE